MGKNKSAEILVWKSLACTKPYCFDVADDSRVCYVEKYFLSKGICKDPYGGVQSLHYDVLKLGNYNSLEESFQIKIDFIPTLYRASLIKVSSRNTTMSRKFYVCIHKIVF